jgi:hypothetical protein
MFDLLLQILMFLKVGAFWRALIEFAVIVAGFVKLPGLVVMALQIAVFRAGIFAVIARTELAEILVIVTIKVAVVRPVVAAVAATVKAVIFPTFVNAVRGAGIVAVLAGVVFILIPAGWVEMAYPLKRVVRIVLAQELMKYLQGFCNTH